jgi:hypothetical protein
MRVRFHSTVFGLSASCVAISRLVSPRRASRTISSSVAESDAPAAPPTATSRPPIRASSRRVRSAQIGAGRLSKTDRATPRVSAACRFFLSRRRTDPSASSVRPSSSGRPLDPTARASSRNASATGSSPRPAATDALARSAMAMVQRGPNRRALDSVSTARRSASSNLPIAASASAPSATCVAGWSSPSGTIRWTAGSSQPHAAAASPRDSSSSPSAARGARPPRPIRFARSSPCVASRRASSTSPRPPRTMASAAAATTSVASRPVVTDSSRLSVATCSARSQ